MSLLDHPLISERYFFPRRVTPPNAVEVHVDGAVLACAAVRVNAAAPTVVHFHGNGEVAADDFPEFADAIAARGLNAFFAEYRGFGGSTGTPALARMLDDVDVLLAASGAPAEQVIVYGRSVGSLFALECIRRHPKIAGLVIESGIADPLERILLRVEPEELGTTRAELEAECNRLLDHQKKLAGYRGPVLILHAKHDSLVPVSHAERLAEWAGPNATRILLDRGDHNTILAFNQDRILDAVFQLALGA